MLPGNDHRPPLRVVYHGEVPRKTWPVIEPDPPFVYCPQGVMIVVFCPLAAGWNAYIESARRKGKPYDGAMNEEACFEQWVREDKRPDKIVGLRSPYHIARFLSRARISPVAIDNEHAGMLVATCFALGFGAHNDRVNLE
jgi:hypothetical protein